MVWRQYIHSFLLPSKALDTITLIRPSLITSKYQENMRSQFSGSAGLALLAYISTVAGAAAPYTDPNTGITFETYSATDVEGFSFGMVFPETLTTDFIGQIVVPLTDGAGWGGVSFGGDMTEHLLFVAWPNGDDIVTSFRLATSYANPAVYTNATLAAIPIANGTFVNSTHLSYTFVCQGCIIGGTTTFAATDSAPIIGYAVSTSNPTSVSDSPSALVYHDAGSNEYGFSTSSAQSASYETWASWASAAAGTSSSTGSNSTASPASNTTTIVTTSNVTYDVIVVGGGPAGIIAAERIAESGVSVLLIERGPANTVALGSTEGLSWNSSLTPYDIPALGSSLTAISGIKFCSDTASTAGCLLGGSSSINGENFIHPPEHDFERWPAGWSWADMSDAANRLYERNPGTTQPSNDGIHYNDLSYTILSSYLKTEGWTEVDSIESPNEKNMVYSRPAWSIKDHLRAGPARTYMPFAQALDNFTLKLNSKVIQVKRNGSSVTGVLTQAADGSQQIINLNSGGKVVLGAGAMSTPRILWNSGIGYSDALKTVQGGSTGVVLPDEADWISLPVGHNLLDHAQIPLLFNTASNFTAFNFNGLDKSPVATDLELYYQGDGPITQASQRMHLWTSANSSDGRTRYFQGTVSTMASGVVTVKTFLTHGASSTGVLGIDATGNTVLTTKPWLASDLDYEAMSSWIQWWLDITNGTVAVASNISMSYSDASATVASIISENLISGDHWVGSTKMGTDDGRTNGTSVVDTNTKVYGTDNLFVVDASIHPDLPTGNTQAIIMMVAEQAAQKIVNYEVTGNASTGNAASTGTTVPSATATATASTSSGPSKCKRSKKIVYEYV